MRRRSTTLIKKPEDVQQSSTPNTRATAGNQVKNVKIYLRRANKTTKIVSFPKNILLNQIFVLVEKELGIARNSQVLFYKGNKISVSTDASSNDKTIQFQEKDIVHVHTLNPSTKSEIKVILEYLSPENIKFKEIHCIMKSHENIQYSLSRAMNEPLDQIKAETFIQSGRKLVVGRKPQEQFIEEGSIITVIDKKNQVLRRQISEQIENILSFPVPEKKKLIKHSTSLEDGLHGEPDFKKKQKGTCLYKSYQMPESKQIIWESDSSTQLNKRQLIKNLYRKKSNNERQNKQKDKKKQLMSISSESSDNSARNVFTLTDKMQLRQQIKKLFQSDCLHNQTELKKLQPPKFSNNDCFIEDVEEIEIDCGEKEQNSDSFSDSDEQKDQFDHKQKQDIGINLKSSFGGAKQLYSSLPLDLRKSIGKTKGNFTPVPLIPTRDFDDDKQMDI